MPAPSRPRRSVPQLLQKLTLLTRRLLGPVPLETILVGVTDGVVDLVAAEHASIRIFDDSGEQLLSSARSGAGAVPPVTVPDEVFSWVATHGLPLSTDDLAADGRFPADASEVPPRSVAVIPLWGRYGVIGALCAGSSRPSAFDRVDVQILTLVGNHAAQVIDQPRMERLAVVDEMTLAYTTRYLLPRLQEEMARAWRDGGTLCLLAVRLDAYEEIRRNHGANAADHVLQAFAQRLRANVRPTDVLVRQGEDRFALVLGGVPEDRTVAVADRLRRATAARAFCLPATNGNAGELLPATISVGAATWDGLEPPGALEARARHLLAQAIAGGGDRVSTAHLVAMAAS